MRLHRWLIVAQVLLLVGCQALRPTPLVGSNLAGAPTYSVQSDTSITGRVDFSAMRQVQATPGQIVDSATVSFIDTSTNATVATGKTNAAGNFSLSLGSYTPTNGATYLLEAVKGLSSQAPGANAARFRTVLQWNGSAWLSCSNAAGGGTILINALTTALAIEASLDPANVPAVLTIGKVNPATTPASLNGTPGPYAGHPDSEVNQLAADLIAYLGVDADPLASVPSIAPTVTSFSPTSGMANSLIRIQGSGFSVVPTGNTVTLNGTAAQVVLATPTALIVVVPSGAATGTVRVQTGRGSVTTASNFTVETASAGGGSGGGGIPAGAIGISGFSPASGRPGSTVTLTGGFGTATPSVVFQGDTGPIAAVVTSFSATTLAATVPVGAITGPITVGNGFATAASLLRFEVQPGNLNTVANLSSTTGGKPYALPEETMFASYAASGSFYYLVGGYDNSPVKAYDTVRMFSISNEGSISSIKTVGRLMTTRYHHDSIALGNYLYVIGGTVGSGSNLAIEYARIYSDGTLGPFQTWNGALAASRNHLMVVAHNQTLYVCGGNGTTSTYEYFTVDTATGLSTASGTGTFALTAGPFNSSLNSAYVVAGNYLYMVGGYSVINGSGAYNRILSFPISSPGVTGNGTLLAATLTGNGSNPRAILRGNRVYAWLDSSVVNTTLLDPATGGASAVLAVAGTPVNLQYSAVHCANDRLYMFGGNNAGNASAQILSTTIKADNTLNAWATFGYLTSPRQAYSGQVMKNRLWLFGGANQGGNLTNGGQNWIPFASTEYFTIEDNGAIGPSVVGPSMQSARFGHTTFMANGYLYVIGGSDNNGLTAINSIERAQINSDGTLGNFTMLPNVTSVPRMFAASAYIGNYIYLFGGASTQNGLGNYSSIERAEVKTDGSLGPFEMLRAQTLPSPRSHMCATIVGDYVYLVGGIMSNAYAGNASVIYARIDPVGGGIGTFKSGPDLTTGVYVPSVAQIGSYLYCFGGEVIGNSGSGYSNTIATIQRAAINADGTLQAWGTAGNLPNNAGYYTGPPHIYNNWVMFLGGSSHTDTYTFNAANWILQSYIQ